MGDAKSLMQYISERIHAHIPRYNWVGFYLLGPTDRSALVLGPHTGSFTPNPTIALNQGLCGAAFSNRQVTVADNVTDDPRYVCASDMVKSHISVPLLVGSEPTGVFSIESYFMAAFKPAVEREFVQTCAQIVVTCAEHTGCLPWSGGGGRSTAPIRPMSA
jgi:GAF domain-containing protein